MKGIKITFMLGHRRLRIVLLVSVVAAVFVMTNLPYIYALRSGGPDYVFGGFLLNPQDGNSYLAKMYQGWRGDWRFTLPYTAEPGSGGYLFLFYLLLGHLARSANFSLLLTFHLFRILGTGLMLLALYHFFKASLVHERLYLPAFTLAALGSGLGWLSLPFGTFTSDFWVAEAYPFLSAYANPHFTLGLALLLWIFVQQIRSPHGAVRNGLLLALAALVLSVISPFGVIIALVVLGAITLWDFQSVAKRAPLTPASIWRFAWGSPLLWVMLGGLPFSLYDFWIVRIDPVLAGWNAQNLTPSPPLWDVVLSLSPALLLALPGAWTLLKRNNAEDHEGSRLLLVWAVLGLLLLYAPFELQRRFMMGIYVPVVGLAVFGLESLATATRRSMSFLVVAVLILILPTNLLVLLAARHGAVTHDPVIYLTRGEADALDWIQEDTPPDALFLAAPETGLFIPAHSGRRVIYGHPFETVNAEAEQELVTRFFQQGKEDPPGPLSTQEAQDVLDRRHVDFVFLGPREADLGGLPSGLHLASVYDNEGVVIYAVPR